MLRHFDWFFPKPNLITHSDPVFSLPVLSSSVCLCLCVRLLSVPQTWHWPSTGICVQPCCLSSLNALLCLRGRSHSPRSSTPCCTRFTACPKDAASPRPRGTPSRSVCWLFAGKTGRKARHTCAVCVRVVRILQCKLLWKLQGGAVRIAVDSVSEQG